MRRFGQNCDDVLTKRGEQVAQYCCMDRATSIASVDPSSPMKSLNARRAAYWSHGDCRSFDPALFGCGLYDLIASFGQNIITVLSETVHV
jgi:hypothetical protein